MKTVFNIVLGLCALALVYICYASIMGPINFEKAKKQRDAAVIARLIDIRKAQLEYRGLHNQQYTASFDTLIDFVKNQKLPFIFKQGELDDKQLEDGLTEKKAINIINKAKKTGNYAEVKKWGLENFKRDTMWVAGHYLPERLQCRLYEICSFRQRCTVRNGYQERYCQIRCSFLPARSQDSV